MPWKHWVKTKQPFELRHLPAPAGDPIRMLARRAAGARGSASTERSLLGPTKRDQNFRPVQCIIGQISQSVSVAPSKRYRKEAKYFRLLQCWTFCLFGLIAPAEIPAKLDYNAHEKEIYSLTISKKFNVFIGKLRKSFS